MQLDVTDLETEKPLMLLIRQVRLEKPDQRISICRHGQRVQQQ